MNIMNAEIANKIEKSIIHPILQKRYDLAAEAIPQFIDELYIYKKRRYRRNDYPGN